MSFTCIGERMVSGRCRPSAFNAVSMLFLDLKQVDNRLPLQEVVLEEIALGTGLRFHYQHGLLARFLPGSRTAKLQSRCLRPAIATGCTCTWATTTHVRRILQLHIFSSLSLQSRLLFENFSTSSEPKNQPILYFQYAAETAIPAAATPSYSLSFIALLFFTSVERRRLLRACQALVHAMAHRSPTMLNHSLSTI